MYVLSYVLSVSFFVLRSSRTIHHMNYLFWSKGFVQVLGPMSALFFFGNFRSRTSADVLTSTQSKCNVPSLRLLGFVFPEYSSLLWYHFTDQAYSRALQSALPPSVSAQVVIDEAVTSSVLTDTSDHAWLPCFLSLSVYFHFIHIHIILCGDVCRI